MKHAQLWVSAVLYLLISAVVVVIVLEGGIPLVKKMQDKALFSKKKTDFQTLAQSVEEVAKEEQGSQRIVTMEVEKGNLLVEDNTVKWKMETQAELLEPGSKVRVGNVNILSNADVRAYEQNDTYVLENSYIRLTINKIGRADAPVTYSTPDIIESLEMIPIKQNVTKGFNFYINTDSDTANGEGYTQLLDYGSGMDKATAIAVMNSTAGNVSYTLKFTLYADTDYFVPTVERN